MSHISIVRLTDDSKTFDTNQHIVSKELQKRIIELSKVESDVVSGWMERSFKLSVRKISGICLVSEAMIDISTSQAGPTTDCTTPSTSVPSPAQKSSHRR